MTDGRRFFGRHSCVFIFQFFGIQMTLCIGGGIDRTFKEDAVMKNMFKDKWVEWSEQTRYRLVPFIF